MQFKDVIKAYLDTKNMKSTELAKRLGYKSQDIDNWLIGLNLPKYGDRYKVLKAVNCICAVDDPDGFSYKSQLKKKYTPERREEYYKSDTWKKKEKERMEIDNYQCALCGSEKDLCVHHLLYNENYGGNETVTTDLITLCKNCHQAVHQNKKNVKKLKQEIQGERKILVCPKADGSAKTYYFTADVTDKQIIAYISKIEKKFKVHYKDKYIISTEGEKIIDSKKLQFFLNN